MRIKVHAIDQKGFDFGTSNSFRASRECSTIQQKSLKNVCQGFKNQNFMKILIIYLVFTAVLNIAAFFYIRKNRRDIRKLSKMLYEITKKIYRK